MLDARICFVVEELKLTLMWLVAGYWMLVAGGTNLLVVKEIKLTLMWLVAGYWMLVAGGTNLLVVKELDLL